MSEAWADAMDSEAYDAFGEGVYDSEAYGEGVYDSEAYGDASDEGLGEESRSARRRRERQRQILLERQRQRQRQRLAQRRPQRPVPSEPRPTRAVGPSPRQTIAAVRSLDLDTKLELDSLRRELKESNRRASRATWGTVAGVAAAEVINQFDALENHPTVSAAILGAPLLLLSPEKHRGGVEGILLDPRVIGGAAVIGIALASRFTSTSKAVHKITVGAPATVSSPAKDEPASTGQLTALAYDRSGNPLLGTQFTWNSSPNDLLTVTPGPSAQTTYTVQPGAEGQETVIITAQAGGITGPATVTVVPA